MPRVFCSSILTILLLSLYVRKNESLSQNNKVARVSSRRDFVDRTSLLFVAVAASSQPAVAATPTPTTSNTSNLSLLQRARTQMDSVPNLIEKEKWDSIRAILIEPPLSDCWSKKSRSLLAIFAEEVGNAGGDELAALEAKEELVSQLRYLDMAVYNNNFNPIKAEGAMNASKSLIASYYEDPMNAYKASIQALDQLLSLSK